MEKMDPQLFAYGYQKTNENGVYTFSSKDQN